MRRMAFVLILFLMGAHARAQSADPNAPLQFARPRGQAAPPALITLQDALARARDIDVSVQLARAEALIAREEVRQSEAELRPSVAYTTDYIGTQGNGVTPNGRYVGADGVHVYRSGVTVHQEVSAHTLLKTGFLRAGAARALADAKAEIAQRGLDFTVSKRYYTLVEAQRRYATAQQAVQQVQRFVDVTQQRETAGEAAHSDVVKAQIQLQQQRRAFQDAGLAIENTRLDLAVLLSTNIDENFSVVDDLDMPKNLPSFDELQAMAEKENPDLKAAAASFRLASSGVRGARNALLPSLNIDGQYGIEANAFKRHSTRAEDPSLGALPNMGYSFTLSLSIPVLDWGANKSKLRVAQARERMADFELTQARREISANLYAFYNEAIAARASVDLSRTGVDLAADSLRLINLRYQSGESGVLEVVDAQNTLIDARNSYDEAQMRFRVSVASLQTLTGGF